MAMVFTWLRGALNRFLDDGGLYSAYNGEQSFDANAPLHIRRVAKPPKPSRWLTTYKA